MPSVEVDLSLANVALDLIGQANHFLDQAGKVEGQGRDGDKLAFHRDVLDFRNCLLVEQPNGDFGQTIARQLLFSTWQHMLYQRLAGSKDERIAAIAAKGVKEVAYHRELAADWTIRLGDGTEESARRTADGLDWCWRFIPELFEMDDIALEAARCGIGADVDYPLHRYHAWAKYLELSLGLAGLGRPTLRHVHEAAARRHAHRSQADRFFAPIVCPTVSRNSPSLSLTPVR